MIWGEVNVIKYLFTFGMAKGDLESSRAGFMRSPVLASWRSPAGRTSGMAIVHCNGYLLLIYLYLLLITHYVFTYCEAKWRGPAGLASGRSLAGLASKGGWLTT